jgi:hypothetical protein
MRMIYFKLMTLGVSAGRVRREIFQAEKIIEIRKPPDLRSQNVTILAGGQEFRISVQYPVTFYRPPGWQALRFPIALRSVNAAPVPPPVSKERSGWLRMKCWLRKT